MTAINGSTGAARMVLRCRTWACRKALNDLASTALLALATSTDAFAAAVGKGTALQKPRWREARRTGHIFGTFPLPRHWLTTFVMVTAGVMLGRIVGAVAGKRAEIVGELLLIGIGTAILYEHLGAA